MSGTAGLTATQLSFAQQYAPLAQSIAGQTGLNPYTVLSQIGLETGFGTSAGYTSNNNLFGISPGGSLASYASPADSGAAYVGLINSSRFSGAASAGADPQSQLAALQTAGYATDPQYATKAGGIASLLQTALPGLTGAGAGAGAGTAGATTGAAAASPSLAFYAGAVVLILGLSLFGMYGLVREG